MKKSENKTKISSYFSPISSTTRRNFCKDELPNLLIQLYRIYPDAMAPPLWAKSFSFHENLLSKVLCFYDEGMLEESKVILRYREPVNIGNTRFYDQDILEHHFGYRTSFYSRSSPNIAVYCQTPFFRSSCCFKKDVPTKVVSDLTSQSTLSRSVSSLMSSSSPSSVSSTSTRPLRSDQKKDLSRVIHCLSVVGVALDSVHQPDYLRLLALPLEEEGVQVAASSSSRKSTRGFKDIRGRKAEYRDMVMKIFLKIRACLSSPSLLRSISSPASSRSPSPPQDETPSCSSSPFTQLVLHGFGLGHFASLAPELGLDPETEFRAAILATFPIPSSSSLPSADTPFPCPCHVSLPPSSACSSPKKKRGREGGKSEDNTITSSSPSSASHSSDDSPSPPSPPSSLCPPHCPLSLSVSPSLKIFLNRSSLSLSGLPHIHPLSLSLEEMVFSMSQEELDTTLFVNAWDPFSLAGNGNAADGSLDGWFGRMSAIAPLCWPLTNPYIRYVEVPSPPFPPL